MALSRAEPFQNEVLPAGNHELYTQYVQVLGMFFGGVPVVMMIGWHGMYCTSASRKADTTLRRLPDGYSHLGRFLVRSSPERPEERLKGIDIPQGHSRARAAVRSAWTSRRSGSAGPAEGRALWRQRKLEK